MILRLRRSIALAVGMLLLLLTLGRVKPNWSGEPAVEDGGPGSPQDEIARLVDPTDDSHT